MLFGIDVIIVAPGPVKTPIWSKSQGDLDASKYDNSPYSASMQRVTAYMAHLDSIGLPPETIAECVYNALTLPKPKTRYMIAPDPMRNFITQWLANALGGRIIPQAVGP